MLAGTDTHADQSCIHTFFPLHIAQDNHAQGLKINSSRYALGEFLVLGDVLPATASRQ